MEKFCRSAVTLHRLSRLNLRLSPTAYVYNHSVITTTTLAPPWSTTPNRQLSDQTNMKWDLAEEIVEVAKLTSPIVPWSELNLISKLFFPYTYSLMHYMDFLLNHMPWWIAIVGTTATFRLLFFPLYVKQTKIGIKSYNLLPETQKIQAKINEATISGDAYERALGYSKMQALLKQNDLGTGQKLYPTLIQAPMFLSMFLLLRRYSNEPLESLATGGGLWFNNLLLADPYYILPTIAAGSTFLLFEFGMEGSMTPSSQMNPMIRWFLRGLPMVIFFITWKFPAAILLFWSTNNVFTLSYALLLKNNWIKHRLMIPERLQHKDENLPLSNQSFSSQFKSAIEQSKVRRTTHDIRRLDDLAFRKAGIGPLQKTYRECPKD